MTTAPPRLRADLGAAGRELIRVLREATTTAGDFAAALAFITHRRAGDTHPERTCPMITVTWNGDVMDVLAEYGTSAGVFIVNCRKLFGIAPTHPRLALATPGGLLLDDSAMLTDEHTDLTLRPRVVVH